MIGPTLVRAHDRLGAIGAMRVVPGFAAPAFADVAARPEEGTRPAKRPRLEADRRRDMIQRVENNLLTCSLRTWYKYSMQQSFTF